MAELAELAELVERRVDAGVGIISLNRPQRHNALDNATMAALDEAFEWAIDTDAIRAVLVRGEGPSFCSGRDTSQLGHRTASDSDYAFVGRSQSHRLRQLDSPKPLIAAVHGACFGLGFETALACDIRVVADDARFALPETQFGLVADTGGTSLLTALIGPGRAKYVLMTAARIDAQTAQDWGIADLLVPRNELDDRALEIATKVAAGPPLAMTMAKQLVDDAWTATVRRGLQRERLAQATLFASADYREARAARAEDRPPEFTGR